MSESLAVFDWMVVGLMLTAMILIGFRSFRQNKSQDDYLVGGKRQKSGIVGLSLFATMFSALSYLSCPGETIKYGPLFLAGMLSYPVSGWIVGKYLIPRFCKYKVTSGYQILEMELGRKSRTLASYFFILLRFMWMSTIMYATVDKVLLPLFGFNRQWFFVICLLLIMITVVYTSLGGISAVLRTDALQSVIMFAGALLTIVVILAALPGIEVFENVGLYSHWQSAEWKLDLHTRMTVTNLFFMELCWQVSTAGSDQMAIQRYLAVKDSKSAARSFSVSLVSSALIKILLACVGVLVMVYFSIYPNQMPQGMGIAENADTLFPYFIIHRLPVGVTGLIVAAIMAAAMSSLSSGLISVSTVIQEDILKKTRRYRDRTFSIGDIRVIAVLIGGVVSISCLLIGKVPGNLYDLTMKVVNLVVEPLFVLFFVAMFIPRGTDSGAFAGGVVSFIVAVLISLVGVGDISEMWIMPIAFAVGVVVALAVSIFSKTRVSVS